MKSVQSVNHFALIVVVCEVIIKPLIIMVVVVILYVYSLAP